MTWNIWRPRIVSALVLAEGARLPRGYGIAWWLPYSQAAYCLPVPFNRITGAFRAWYLEWRRPCEDDPIITIYQYAHSVGFEAGNNHGLERGLRLAKDLMK